jgi:hypothetical protein
MRPEPAVQAPPCPVAVMPGSSRPIGDCSRILGAIHELGGWRSGRSPRAAGWWSVCLPTTRCGCRSLETVLNGIQIIGSIAGTQVDMAEVFQLHARGRTLSPTSGARWSRSTSPSLTSWPAESRRGSARPWVGDDHSSEPDPDVVPSRAGGRCSTRPPSVLARTPGVPSPGHQGGPGRVDPRPSLISSTAYRPMRLRGTAFRPQAAHRCSPAPGPPARSHPPP